MQVQVAHGVHSHEVWQLHRGGEGVLYRCRTLVCSQASAVAAACCSSRSSTAPSARPGPKEALGGAGLQRAPAIGRRCRDVAIRRERMRPARGRWGRGSGAGPLSSVRACTAGAGAQHSMHGDDCSAIVARPLPASSHSPVLPGHLLCKVAGVGGAGHLKDVAVVGAAGLLGAGNVVAAGKEKPKGGDLSATEAVAAITKQCQRCIRCTCCRHLRLPAAAASPGAPVALTNSLTCRRTARRGSPARRRAARTGYT